MSTTISAAQVKELRDATGAPMMDAKRALQETDGDLDAARTLLRERGMAQVAKRAGRATTEGMVGYRIADGYGTIVGLGCETEPVSKNEEFQAFAKRLFEAVHAGGPRRRGVARAGSCRHRGQARREHRRRRRGAVRSGRGRGSQRLRPPAREQDRRAREARRRHGGARATARDAHLVRLARVDDEEDVPAEVVEAEKQVYLNSDELAGQARAGQGEDRGGHAPRSASSPRSPAARSPSSRGSTTRRRP